MFGRTDEKSAAALSSGAGQWNLGGAKKGEAFCSFDALC